MRSTSFAYLHSGNSAYLSRNILDRLGGVLMSAPRNRKSGCRRRVFKVLDIKAFARIGC